MSMFPDDWLPSQLTFEPERLVIVHVNNNNISQAVVVVVFSRSSKPHISSKPKSHHLVFSLVVYRTFFGGRGGEVREGGGFWTGFWTKNSSAWWPAEDLTQAQKSSIPWLITR